MALKPIGLGSLIMFIVLMAWHGIAAAAIQHCVDVQGNHYYSDVGCPTGESPHHKPKAAADDEPPATRHSPKHAPIKPTAATSTRPTVSPSLSQTPPPAAVVTPVVTPAATTLPASTERAATPSPLQAAWRESGRRIVHVGVALILAGGAWYLWVVWRAGGWAGLALTRTSTGEAIFDAMNFRAVLPAYLLGGLGTVIGVAGMFMTDSGEPPDTRVTAKSDLYRCIGIDMTADTSQTSFLADDQVCLKSLLKLSGSAGSSSRNFEWHWYRGDTPREAPESHLGDLPPPDAEIVTRNTIDWDGSAPYSLIGMQSARSLGPGKHLVLLYMGTLVRDPMDRAERQVPALKLLGGQTFEVVDNRKFEVQ